MYDNFSHDMELAVRGTSWNIVISRSAYIRAWEHQPLLIIATH